MNSLKYHWAICLTSCMLLFGGVAFADSECGPGNWVNTGVQGPWGWYWHYDQSRTVGNSSDANAICATFYKSTNNCNNSLPGSYGKYIYKSCGYDTGQYTIDAINKSTNAEIKTVCQAC